jgi:hypothetical protein
MPAVASFSHLVRLQLLAPGLLFVTANSNFTSANPFTETPCWGTLIRGWVA